MWLQPLVLLPASSSSFMSRKSPFPKPVTKKPNHSRRKLPKEKKSTEIVSTLPLSSHKTKMGRQFTQVKDWSRPKQSRTGSKCPNSISLESATWVFDCTSICLAHSCLFI
jgi:hypothetical protein